MNFSYDAIDSLQRDVRGRISASEENEAYARLQKANLIVKSVLPDKTRSKKRKMGLIDLAIFCESLAEQMETGIPPRQALLSIAASTASEDLKNRLLQIIDLMDRGYFLSQAMSQTGFGVELVQVVRIAESVGVTKFEGAPRSAFFVLLRQYSAWLRKLFEIRRQLRQALIMPAITLLVSFAVFLLGALWLIPQFEVIFKSLLEGKDAELPFITQVMLSISHVLTTPSYAVLLVASAAAVALVGKSYLQSNSEQVQSQLLRLPIIGDVLRLYHAAQFIRSLAILSEGIPSVLERIRIAAETATHPEYRQMCEHVLRTLETKAVGLSDVLGVYQHLLTPDIYQVLKIIEETGMAEYQLRKLSESLERQLEEKIKALTKMAEAAFIIIPGGVVLFILLALYLPMFEFIYRFASR